MTDTATAIQDLQHLLDEFVDRLRTVAGEGLASVVLYGSAANGEFHSGHSDLNLLCLFRELPAHMLDRIRPTLAWWHDQQQPAPTLMTSDELARSTDIFPIEIMDIQARHKVLHGSDRFLGLTPDMAQHRVQLEHELRRNLNRLRQAYVAAENDAQRLALMTDSLATFTTLFRHALVALGERPPAHRREVVDRLASTLQFDASAFHRLLDVREKRGKPEHDVRGLFAKYLDAIARATAEMDRKLEQASPV